MTHSTIAMTLAAFACSLAFQAPTVRAGNSEPVKRLAIVDRAIAHHGGELYRATDTELRVCSKSGCFEVRAQVDDERFDYTVSGSTTDGHRRVRVTNDRVWLWLDDEPVPVQAREEQGLRDWVMERVYFCFLPYRLNDPSVYKRDRGLEEWNGRTLHRVEISFAPGSSSDAEDRYAYWFDPQSGRVEQFAYSFRGRPGGLRFRLAHNFRRIGGLLFFDQKNLGVEGPDLTVEQITPDFVDERMREVSQVRLSEIKVRPIDRHSSD